MIAIQQYRPYMTIIHRPGKMYNNAYALSRMALPNSEENPAWDPEERELEIPIMGISLAELSEEFFEEIREIYNKNHNIVKLVEILARKEKKPTPHQQLRQPLERILL